MGTEHGEEKAFEEHPKALDVMGGVEEDRTLDLMTARLTEGFSRPFRIFPFPSISTV